MKSVIVTFAKFLVPAVIIAVLLFRLDPDDWDNLRQRPVRVPVLTLAFGIAFLAIATSFVRWWLLVRCQGIRLSVIESFRLSSICFLLSFVSAGSVGGDLFKAVFLARRSPGKRIEAVASVIVDRGAGLYGLLLLVAAALILRPGDGSIQFEGISIRQLQWLLSILVCFGTSVLLTLVLGGNLVDSLIGRFAKLPVIGGLVSKIGPPLRAFHDYPIAFLISLVMSVAVHAMLTISMFLIAASLFDSIPTFAEHFLIVPLGMLASALPITPAGIGVLEATIGTLYEIVPASPASASGVLVALVFELVKIGLAIIGTVFYWTASSEETASLEQVEVELASAEREPMSVDDNPSGVTSPSSPAHP